MEKNEDTLYDKPTEAQIYKALLEDKEAEFNKQLEAAYLAAIRLVMTACNRKNLIITEDVIARANNLQITTSEINGNPTYQVIG